MARTGDKAMALVASSADGAEEAEQLLRQRYDFVDFAEAEMVLALGGDGFLLQTLHDMLAADRLCPVAGTQRGRPRAASAASLSPRPKWCWRSAAPGSCSRPCTTCWRPTAFARSSA